ncbi:ABC protein [Roridomyces roridus]|uniref:ABC protein n=1 Tax=Roridomyces roridus TaxID=1738132 RepID=A0AAD7C5C0_9AGAR|nr:ABC protein [Roridomyces roridus]
MVSTTTTQEKEGPTKENATQHHNGLDLDSGDEVVRFRQRWWQLWLPATRPPPAPESLEDAPISPYVTASFISRLTYSWYTPMMMLGFQRTLQASDLWKMGPEQEAGYLTDKLEAAWAARIAAAEAHNERLANGQIKPPFMKRAWWAVQGREKRAERHRWWREEGGKQEPSLAWSLNDVLGKMFWKAGLYKVCQDTSQLMGPLLIKSLINFAKARAAAAAAGDEPPGVGRGIGMAIGLLCLIILASVCQHQFFFASMTSGVFARAALTGMLYRRTLHFTPASRLEHPNSAILNHISTDVSRVDTCAQWFHAAWTAPIQTTICLIILLVFLGPSALAGFALFILIIPLQERMLGAQHRYRRESMKYTDARSFTFLEIISSMRVVKYFCYEKSFLARIFEMRKQELRQVRKIQHNQSLNNAMAFSLPVLTATLAFVTYTKTTEKFDVAVIFASFSLFQLLRYPMMFLPRALSATTDARIALKRLSRTFRAPVRQGEPFIIDRDMELAVWAEGVGWVWEAVNDPSKDEGKGKKAKVDKEKPVVSEKEDLNSSSVSLEPFALKNISLSIPRQSLVALVGRVGSGKSSLLQGLIGDMRSTGGKWAFGGSVAYCPQTAWIQNATLRENVLFGRPYEEERYWRVIEAACLLPDLALLADGDLTEIGEKGINLSGGQKQRVNIARAMYYNADVYIFDDPLSAVDAHVGKALFNGAIRGLIAEGKTVLLVTHALHFLAHCDYIYTLSNGSIMEEGTYPELVARGGVFAALDREFGGGTQKKRGSGKEGEEEDAPMIQVMSVEDAKARSKAAGTGKKEGKLMVKEKRTTGGVEWRVYGQYMKAGGGWVTVPAVVLAAVLMQSSAVINSYVLVWWQANTFNKPFSFYQTLYALLGVSQSFFTLVMGYTLDFFSVRVSRNLHDMTILNVFHAPMSFFDTTPMGRIMSIFGKDIDAIDNNLPISMRMFTLALAQVLGSVIVISILEPYFLIAACAIIIAFGYFLQFYRATALETKRLDALLRSVLYAHLSESLTGLPTIRSYGEIPRFIKGNAYHIDLQNRALFLTVTYQRWLAIRLDACGAVLVFLVGIFAAVGVSGITAGQIGLILTYTTTISSMLAVTTRMSAEVENYMNSVERVIHYASSGAVPQEAPHESTPENKPPPHWPSHGAIQFKDVTMSYRPGLPNILHGISLEIKAGERVGIVGRTGAGKSSLTLCLLRIVEYLGQIIVDGVDIGKIGLTDLRANIAIIPQEPTLFSGTVRAALDPFSKYDDARLWAALRRSYLVESRPSTPAGSETELNRNSNRITLDTIIEQDGANLSVGERSLLNLARALVKDSRVVVLDEATASVDLETDNKIQHTIQTQFRNHTLICIAHRLRTILSYDRILVLDGGKIVEFDTPLNLFSNMEGIFRSLCDKSNISSGDIEKAIVEQDRLDREAEEIAQ